MNDIKNKPFFVIVLVATIIITGILIVAGVNQYGRPQSAVDVIQKLRDAGYECDQTNPVMAGMYNGEPKVSYSWCNAVAYTIWDTDQAQSDEAKGWGRLYATLTTYGGVGFHAVRKPDDYSLPMWDLVCLDEACKAAARAAGFTDGISTP
ncbi:hypothetical protein Pth03_45010 [Planotetraspora thailandica]|uniref:Uncharacterized protein n=1 Tax=Planotetraspora thailandica TaxID=487172 RepID=A0A8J3V5U1_9ACTN|nr:hypothetical protein [Planotetraspora thailandica]GII56112.1 hypothetical protein Pth03_45010 [Planotetraspora thailandica]